MRSNGQMRYRYALLLYGIVSILACISLARVLLKTNELRDIDFHSYWYAGHFIWQFNEPYSSTLDHEEPSLPVYYLDGETQRSGSVIHHPGSSNIPGITAPALLLISILSRFSWPTATRIWIAVNLGMLLVIAWVCSNYFESRLLSKRGTFILFVLASLISTREAIETGQSTLFVLGFALLALFVVERSQIAGGVLLGIGLSKFTLAFPVFLILLYRRKFLASFISVAIQIVGTGLLAWIGHTSLLNVMASYFQILATHTDLPGMHLAQGLFRNNPLLQIAFGGTGLLAIGVILHRLLRSIDGRDNSLETKVRTWALLTALMMLNLLMLYHRRYDFTAGILFLALVVFTASSHENLWARSVVEKKVIIIAAALIAVVWIMPLYLMVSDLLYIYVYNIASIAAFGITLWMLYRLTQVRLSSHDTGSYPLSHSSTHSKTVSLTQSSTVLRWHKDP